MASRAATLSQGLSGFRNRFINGAMEIWQRGTSVTNPAVAGQFYTADRWGCNRASDVTGATASRSTSAPTGFKNSFALQRTAANATTNALFLFYSAESQDVIDLAGQQVTFSLWAKAGANYSGGSLTIQVITGTGTDERVYAYTGSSIIINTTQAITTTWTRYAFTGTVPSNATEIGLELFWTPSGTAGADDTVYLTGLQLELGAAATAFEKRPTMIELALCQRYYEKSFAIGTAPVQNVGGSAGAFEAVQVVGASTSSHVGCGYFAVRKRIIPTMVTYNPSAANAQLFNTSTGGSWTLTTTVPGEGSFYITGTSAAGTGAGQGAVVHWTADSEL